MHTDTIFLLAMLLIAMMLDALLILGILIGSCSGINSTLQTAFMAVLLALSLLLTYKVAREIIDNG